ncbi:flagellin [Salipiger mucosus]|uniref:Flagellin n=1 Tax=Salipiger mucosus DSM 16094 TaxID=1123237 RepID=S9QUX6_9RHOB|nr:flagellin [Salipiger mucosus]EPX85176.1 Flagellin protein FlaA [Salipiger mucosus DSM 16094]
MSSILTNEGAMTALQTLRSIGGEIETTQAEIATGRKVARPGDNAAVWAIAKTMEADVAGFRRVSESLALGDATLSVARRASETVTDLLTEIKGKVVTAQEQNVDRAKIQNDVDALRDQIGAVVGMAQFNGLNLLENREAGAGTGSVAILGGLDRGSAGVEPAHVTIRKRDLGTGASQIAATGGTYAAGVASVTLNDTRTGTIDLAGEAITAGTAFSLSVFGTDADGSSFDQADWRTTAAAAQTQGEMAAGSLGYVARDGDTAGDVARALARRWEAYALGNGRDADVLAITATGGGLRLSSEVTDGSDRIAVSLNRLDADAGNTIGGGLEMLAELDVTTAEGAALGLGQIESLIGVGIEVSAEFGSDQRRLETQADFVSGLSDSLRAGIGTLVDTDLEEASARLQALQVQQQLAVQALSIANSAPGALLGLFR